MSELRKANTDAPYFLSLSVVGWIDVFTRSTYADELITNLNYCQSNKGLEVYAYVIMPSHLHLIARRNEGSLNELMREFKSYMAKRILHLIENNPQESRKIWLLYLFRYYARHQKQNAHYQFWQKTSHPIALFSPAVLQQMMDYIHQNPVEAGIVDEAQHYVYSSANPGSPLKVLDV
jgi:putative transposase